MNEQPDDATGLMDALAAPGGDTPGEPIPWGECFLIDGLHDSPIPLLQVTGKDFEFTGTLTYTGEMGLEKYPEISEETKEAARTVSGSELGVTDLASIPLFVRWFVGPYGRHTPAAMIHDHLIIGGSPNGGALGSDTASDRYWRFMLDEVGVPLIKRWIMWAATALRSRWAVGGWRRFTVLFWLVLALFGITAAVVSTIALISDGDLPWDAEPGLVLIASLVLPLVASALWGKQFGAALVAAGAAVWLLPPTILATVGYAIYWVAERVLRGVR